VNHANRRGQRSEFVQLIGVLGANPLEQRINLPRILFRLDEKDQRARKTVIGPEELKKLQPPIVMVGNFTSFCATRLEISRTTRKMLRSRSKCL